MLLFCKIISNDPRIIFDDEEGPVTGLSVFVAWVGSKSY